MNDYEKKLFPRQGRLFAALTVLAVTVAFDIGMTASSVAEATEEVSSRYDVSDAYRLAVKLDGNHQEYGVPTLQERAETDPFEALESFGINSSPLRRISDRYDLDLKPLSIALADDRISKAVIPAADKKCLAQAIYYESRSETSAGQMAVADVILNRVESRYYPDNICGVVYQGSHRQTGCQFSFTCDGSMNRSVDVMSMKRSERMAEAVLSGLRFEVTRGALNYHARYIRPYWAAHLQKTATVDDHVFYVPARYARLEGQGSSSGQ